MYNCNLGTLFENIASTYSERQVLKFIPSRSISYKEFNQKSNQIACYLIELGIQQDDVICISGLKSVETFACMIGCLKIGAIYTVIDPSSPVERLRKIILRCLPKLLFVNSQLEKVLQELAAELGIDVVNTESESFENKINSCSGSNLESTQSITGSNPAYIMFTSGSTGFPKGAVMTHDNLLNLISWSIDTFDLKPTDILTNVNPLYFDNSVFDIYSTLFSGACLAPFPMDVIRDPRLLVDHIDDLGCTSWFSVPSLLIYLDTMKVLNRDNMRSIKRFIFGGEGYPKAKLKNIYDLYSRRADFFNVYGPTECTCICSSHKIVSGDFSDLSGFPPLGKIAKNFSYLVLKDDNTDVQDNETGELCLLGPNVGKGYYNDPEKTNEKFVQSPHNSSYPDRMYKTGDLVKYNLKDRNLYFVGRKDNQIKHMGYRIELEEIEVALHQLEYISQATKLLEPTTIGHVAIGGINCKNIEQVLKAGAKAIAVSAAVSGADNPEDMCRTLKKIIKNTTNDIGELPVV